MSRILIRRTAVLSLVLPFLYFGTASATFLYRLHAENSARAGVRLPVIPRPNAAQRLLIFSPHPDDETLGCGGLIQQAVAAGADVRVVFLTNGDGFRVGVEREFRKLGVQPSDYVRFAAVRQEETYRALEGFGVGRQNVTFLGYPDRGLLALWTDHWSARTLYTSPYTRQDRSPYPNSWHVGAPYCGQRLLDDVKALMIADRPTDVYVTHPSDDHIDHTAASSFVALACQELHDTQPWMHGTNLHYYLVHRGDWPAPQGLYESDELVPPTEMTDLDTRWTSRPLTMDQVARKEASILDYESQTAVMKRFLVSFARRNELFGELATPTVPRVPDGAILVDGKAGEWKSLSPLVLDPVNDNLLRDFQGGGDIKAVYACRDAATLYIRVDTSKPISARIRFHLYLRYFGVADGVGGGTYFVTLGPGAASAPPELRCGVRANRVEVAIPLHNLAYAHRLALDVETSFAGILVDRTGYRFMAL